ncbi:MAG: type II toxin-antitoxin system RelE/ParE family toxin [Candidatus Omnitrophota bacterium]
MGKYSIRIKRSAAKEISDLPRRDLKEVLDKIVSLADNSCCHGSQKLCADEKYRIRCGDYRILYAIEGEILIVYVVKVAHRKEAYR